MRQLVRALRIFDEAPASAGRAVLPQVESVTAVEAPDKYRVAVTLPQRDVGFEVVSVKGYCRGIDERSVLIFICQALAVHAVDLPGLLYQR
ncbi:hypothetical protein PSYAC_25563 [Pseudomonas syringae pv. actinidiae str. M302091]|nr:hypothetical protein PSYAC_25563 [Pseudomonas syringae pv. actinidiae str. M302091]